VAVPDRGAPVSRETDRGLVRSTRGGKEVSKMTLKKKLVRKIQAFRHEVDGQGLAEYALILALIAVLAIVSLLFLGSQVSDKLSVIGSTINSVAVQ
jgi:Flp pilus assembly pilin Flp